MNDGRDWRDRRAEDPSARAVRREGYAVSKAGFTGDDNRCPREDHHRGEQRSACVRDRDTCRDRKDGRENERQGCAEDR